MRANNLFVLGLTGGICSGKSEAARILKSLGAFHIDADAISHALTAPGGEALPAIRETFGEGVFLPDGSLDRRALAAMVFGQEAYKRQLEAILHPLIQRDMLKKLDEASESGAQVAVLDVPLLFETGMDAMCDEVWVMSAERETQIRRMAERDRLSREEAEARIDAQMPDEERRARATRVFSSDKPLDRTEAEIAGLYQQILRRI